MSAIVDFLVTLGESIVSAFDLVVSFFGDLLYMIDLMVQLVPAIPRFFTWLPSTVLVTFELIITVVVLFRILGRSD